MTEATTFPCPGCQGGIPMQAISNLPPGSQFIICCPHCGHNISGGVGRNQPGPVPAQIGQGMWGGPSLINGNEG